MEPSEHDFFAGPRLNLLRLPSFSCIHGPWILHFSFVLSCFFFVLVSSRLAREGNHDL